MEKTLKEKSLRQLARELGVSASYLSQVKNGKKKLSKDLLSKIDIKVLTNLVNTHNVDFRASTVYNYPCAEVAQLVEQRTENPRVPSSILGLGTKILRRKWLSGRASPCQGEGREFESRLPLHGVDAEVAEWQTRQSQKLLEGDLRVGSSPTFGTWRTISTTGHHQRCRVV